MLRPNGELVELGRNRSPDITSKLGPDDAIMAFHAPRDLLSTPTPADKCGCFLLGFGQPGERV